MERKKPGKLVEVTDKQMAEFQESFDHFDQNRDRFITIKELKHVMEKLGFAPTTKELKAFMEEADSDRNGKIDFLEFLSVMKIKMQDMMRLNELEKAFAVFDYNRDGRISRAELRYVLGSLEQHFDEEQIKDMIEVADLNSDGFIDFDEFRSLVRPEF